MQGRRCTARSSLPPRRGAGSSEILRHVYLPPHFYIWWLGGGVFFFILSGFIITSVHWQDVGNARRLPGYIFKRFVRVYPIYWIVFVLVLTGLAFIHHEDFPKDVSTVVAALALVPQDPATVGGTGNPVVVVGLGRFSTSCYFTRSSRC
jgi:peptidoglycan/LPS O-acetylase OafA/YrhL